MRSTFAALRFRNYRIFAGAGFVSVIGTWMQVLGINWYVLQQTGSATKMGLAVLLQTIPALLLSGWGGALADRLPARPLLVGTQVVSAVLAAALAVVAWSGTGGLPAIYAISLLGGAVVAIEGPVMGRWGSTLVDRKTLGNALALGSLTNSAGRILGMSVGAVLVAAAGPGPLFAINAVSFGAVVVALLAVRPGELHTEQLTPTGGDERGGVRAGLAYLRRQPVVLTALLLSFVLGSLGRNYQVTMAAMSDGPLHAGASGYGSFSTVFAVGTVVGALVAARLRELSYGMLVGAGLLASLLQICAGLAPGALSFAALVLPIAAAAVLIDTAVGTRAQLDTAGAMRGRVLAALAVTGSVSGAVGAPLLGWLAEHAGPRQTLVLAGTAAALASATAGVALGALRGRQRPGEERSPLSSAPRAGRRSLAAVVRDGGRPLAAALREPVGRGAARLRPRATVSRTCPGGHGPLPVSAHGTRTARSDHGCAACAPRYGRRQHRSAVAATRPATEAGSPRR